MSENLTDHNVNQSPEVVTKKTFWINRPSSATVGYIFIFPAASASSRNITGVATRYSIETTKKNMYASNSQKSSHPNFFGLEIAMVNRTPAMTVVTAISVYPVALREVGVTDILAVVPVQVERNCRFSKKCSSKWQQYLAGGFVTS